MTPAQRKFAQRQANKNQEQSSSSGLPGIPGLGGQQPQQDQQNDDPVSVLEK